MYRNTTERPSIRPTRSMSPDMEVEFLKSPSGQFIEDSSSDPEYEDPAWQAEYFRQISLNRDGPFVKEDHSGTFLPEHPTLNGWNGFYTGYRPIMIQQTAVIPKLDVLVARNSSEGLPRPFSDQDDSFPDLSVLRVKNEHIKHRIRPFSAKPRVLRKYHLRTDQTAHDELQSTSSSPAQWENEHDEDVNMSTDDEGGLENKIVPFSKVKWLLPADEEKAPKPAEPRHKYPYTKLQPLPLAPIRCIPEEEEEGEYLVSTARLNRARNAASASSDESETDEKKKHTKSGPKTKEK